MKIAEDESQRNDFRNILFELAKDQEMLQDSKTLRPCEPGHSQNDLFR